MKKSKANLKKISLVMAVMLVLIRIIYIWVGEEVRRTSYYSGPETISESACRVEIENGIVQRFKTENSRLESIELLFTNIHQEHDGVLIMQILSNEELLWQSNITVQSLTDDVWHHVYVNIPTESDKEYDIKLIAEAAVSDICVYVVEDTDGASEASGCILSDQKQQGQVLMRYGYSTEPSMGDKVLSSMVWCFILFVLYIFIYYFEKICRVVKGIGVSTAELLGIKESYASVAIFQTILAYILIESSGIEFQISGKVLLLSVSLISALKGTEKKEYLQQNLVTTRSKIGFIFADLYAAFALVGNRLFIYPLYKHVLFQEILVFVVAAIWFIPIVASFMFWYAKIEIKQKKNRLFRSEKWFVVVVIILLLVPAGLALYGFNPGITTVDSELCLAENAHSLRGMTNWHPPFYCMLLRGIITIWDSTYAVIFVQYIFWVYVLVEMLLFLKQKGMGEKFLIFVAFITGINAANYLQISTIWKDIPYTLSLLWLTVIIAKLVLGEAKARNWYTYLELVVSLVFTFYFRQNGMVIYVLTVVLLALALRKNYKIYVALGISLLLVLFIRFPVYSYLEVQETGGGGAYIGLSQDILGVYYSGGEVSSDTIKMINVLTNYNNAEFGYDPYYATSTYNLDVSYGEFIANYLDTFIKNPILMLREIVCRQDCIWDIFGGENATLSCVNYQGTIDGYNSWNDYYPAHEQNCFSIVMAEITNYTASNQILNVIIWRSGLSTLIVILAVFTALMNKTLNKRWILILTPFVGQILSLMLSTGWSDFRYYWSLNLMGGFIMLVLPTMSEKKKKEF